MSWLRRLALPLRVGVSIVPSLPIYVSTSLLFPYASGRNFVFRILIELLIISAAAVLWLPNRHRRSLSPLAVALLAFVPWIVVADALGANPYRSFWSTYQRMEGLVGFAHLILFFFILQAALRSRTDWLRYFRLSVAAGSLVAVVALFQYGGGLIYGSAGRPNGGTIGNAGILAGYLLLQVFLCWLLLVEERRILSRRLLITALCLDLVTIYVSGTRSAILSLAIVGSLLAVITAWRGRRAIRSLTPALTS